VVDARKVIIELMLSSGNHNCAVRGSDGQDWTGFQLRVQADDGSGELCPVWGDCRLQDLAYRYQVNGERFPSPGNPAIPWRRSIRSSSGIFPAASNAAAVSRPATTSRSTTPSVSATAAPRTKIIAAEATGR
jgi:hypothetical protein